MRLFVEQPLALPGSAKYCRKVNYIKYQDIRHTNLSISKYFLSFPWQSLICMNCQLKLVQKIVIRRPHTWTAIVANKETQESRAYHVFLSHPLSMIVNLLIELAICVSLYTSAFTAWEVFELFPSYPFFCMTRWELGKILKLILKQFISLAASMLRTRCTNNRPFQTEEQEKLTRKFYKKNFCALLGDGACI